MSNDLIMFLTGAGAASGVILAVGVGVGLYVLREFLNHF